MTEFDSQREHIESSLTWLANEAQECHRIASKMARLSEATLVLKSRLQSLEDLEAAVEEAIKSCYMTRDYKDVQEHYGVEYAGKKFLVDRTIGGKVSEALGRCRRTKKRI